MGDRLTSTMVAGLVLLASCATLVFAQPAAALDADYWRGGWRTPLGDAPHIYYFVIRGRQVTGEYCRSCSDATTIGFIDGTWEDRTESPSRSSRIRVAPTRVERWREAKAAALWAGGEPHGRVSGLDLLSARHHEPETSPVDAARESAGPFRTHRPSGRHPHPPHLCQHAEPSVRGARARDQCRSSEHGGNALHG